MRNIVNSVKYRKKLADYGIYYLSKQDFDISSLRVRNKRIAVAFPNPERDVLEFELYSILINDCYHLAALQDKIHTVLDVGANIGLFTIAASYYFPSATVHAYEPNSSLDQYLRQNCNSVDASYFLEAVGLKDSYVSLEKNENSLHSVALKTDSATISCLSFRKAIEKLGSVVDLVKLDCEGAEWEIFEDTETWSKVRHLTMEYHLWAKPGSSFEDILAKLERINFVCTNHEPASSGQWGLLQAYNRTFAK